MKLVLLFPFFVANRKDVVLSKPGAYTQNDTALFYTFYVLSKIATDQLTIEV